jgi:NB-ARC domain
VDNQEENKWQPYLGREVFQSSLVEICAADRKAIGCFVTPNKILTCLHSFRDIDVDRLEINSIDGERQNYQIARTAISDREYPDIDLLVIEVKTDRYRNRACVELDLEPDERASDSFSIYHSSRNTSTLIPIASFSRSESSKQLEFSSTWQKSVNLIGCPIINQRTGKVYGIVSELDDSSASSSSQLGRAISVREIINKLPDIKAGNQYITNVLCNLPEGEQHKFIGREKELQTLFQYLSPRHTQHILEINGTSGIGKTELAITAANKCLLSYQKIRSQSNIPIFDAVVFLSLENNNRVASKDYPEAGLLRILGVIGDTLKIPSFDRYAEAEDFNRVYEALSRRTTLLILDGWDDSIDSDRIWDFINNVPYPTKVIVTARERKSSYSCISLNPLTVEESRDFIFQQAAIKGLKLEDSEVSAILDSVPRVPIILTHAIDQFRTGNYEEDRILDLASASDPAIFDIDRSIDSIAGTSTAAILKILSFFATSASIKATVDISSKLLISGKGLELENALDRLDQLGLILKFKSITGKDRYRLLPIVRECVLDRPDLFDKTKSDEARSRWVKWYCNFVQSSPIDELEELEDEWGNIKEVLIWCKNERDVNSVKEIWLHIDELIERKQDWAIRLYWWQYLLEQFSRRGALLHVHALLALVHTCLKMGKKKLAEKYFGEASVLLKESYELKKAINTHKREEYVAKLSEMRDELMSNQMVAI